jgi:hypothetical protein
MPRTFITERDIAAYAAQGLDELPIGPDTVLTDMAVERARAAKIRLVPTPEATPEVHSVVSPAGQDSIHAQIRAAVINRLGREPEALDAIIRSILNHSL